MGTLILDLRQALRQLARSPGFALAAIGTLALGIGVNTAVFSVFDAALLRPLPYPDPDRLVTVWPGRWFSQEGYESLRGRFSGDSARGGAPTPFEHLAAWAGESVILTGDDEPERLEGRRVDAGYFETLGVEPLLGRGFRAAETRPGAPPVVVLSHGLWQRRFGGDPEIVGRRVEMEGETYSVIGVLPSGFHPLEPEGQLWLPLVLDPGEALYRQGHYLRVLARLAPGISAAQAGERLAVYARREREKQGLSDALVESAGVTPLQAALTGPVRPRLLVLIAAVALVLLIACSNVANLLLARSVRRQREMAIRSALGAGRRRLIRQLLTESLVLGSLAGAAGLLLAHWTLPLLVGGLPEGAVPGAVGVDLRVLGFTACTALATTLLFSLAPTVFLTRRAPRRTFSTRGTDASSGCSRTQRWLIGSEAALALMLLLAAGLLGRSLWRLEHVDPGFKPEGLVSMTLYLDGVKPDFETWRSLVRQALERVGRLPGVVSAGAVHTLPIGGGGWVGRLEVEGRPDLTGESAPGSYWRAVDDGYFRTLEVPVVRGRDFAPTDGPTSEPVAVINRTLAERLWPNGNPLGHRLRIDFEHDAGWVTVVGVVADVRLAGLASELQPVIYRPYGQSMWPVTMRLVLRSALPADTLAREVRLEVGRVDPRIAVEDSRTFPEVIRRSTAAPRSLAGLVGAFAALAFVLGLVGIYGVLSYVVAGRSGEIGVRMALGARRSDVLGWALRQGLTPVTAGLATGLAGAWMLSRGLASQLFGVGEHDAWTFALAPFALALAAVLACWLPAHRAARVDPATALRSE